MCMPTGSLPLYTGKTGRNTEKTRMILDTRNSFIPKGLSKTRCVLGIEGVIPRPGIKTLNRHKHLYSPFHIPKLGFNL